MTYEYETEEVAETYGEAVLNNHAHGRGPMPTSRPGRESFFFVFQRYDATNITYNADRHTDMH